MAVAIVGNYNHCHFATDVFYAPVEAFGVAFQICKAAVINDSGVTIIRMGYVYSLCHFISTVIPLAEGRRTKWNRHKLILAVYTFQHASCAGRGCAI
jgi:hypothetical protein